MLSHRLVAALATSLLLLLASSVSAFRVPDANQNTPRKATAAAAGVSTEPKPARFAIGGASAIASGGACCADYPLCGCPKLGMPGSSEAATTRTSKAGPRGAMRMPPRAGISPVGPRMPGAKIAIVRASGGDETAGGCCADYPFCGCPKI